MTTKKTKFDDWGNFDGRPDFMFTGETGKTIECLLINNDLFIECDPNMHGWDCSGPVTIVIPEDCINTFLDKLNKFRTT